MIRWYMAYEICNRAERVLKAKFFGGILNLRNLVWKHVSEEWFLNSDFGVLSEE